SDPAAAACHLAAFAAWRRALVLGCQGRGRQGLRGTALYHGTPPGPAQIPKDAGQVLPVPPLRSQPGTLPVGLLPRQGGGVRRPVPASGPSLVCGPQRVGGPGPGSRAPLPMPADAPTDAGTEIALD